MRENYVAALATAPAISPPTTAMSLPLSAALTADMVAEAKPPLLNAFIAPIPALTPSPAKIAINNPFATIFL